MKSSMESSQKIKIRTTMCSNSSTLGYFSKQTERLRQKMYAPHVHCSFIYNSQGMEATQVSINGQIKKNIYII